MDLTVHFREAKYIHSLNVPVHVERTEATEAAFRSVLPVRWERSHRFA